MQTVKVIENNTLQKHGGTEFFFSVPLLFRYFTLKD
jgi:hypothetical protein